MRYTAFAPDKTDTRLSKEAAIEHPTMLQTIMGMWDLGWDTKSIADKLFEHESVISFCVRMGREQRREAQGRS